MPDLWDGREETKGGGMSIIIVCDKHKAIDCVVCDLASTRKELEALKNKTCSCGGHLMTLCPLCDSDFDSGETVLATLDSTRKELENFREFSTRQMDDLQQENSKVRGKLEALKGPLCEHAWLELHGHPAAYECKKCKLIIAAVEDKPKEGGENKSD